MFNALTQEILVQIANKFLNELRDRLLKKDITVTFSDETKKLIVSQGSDAQYGARPMKRYIQKEIETLIAKNMIEGTITANSAVVVDVENNEFVVNKQQFVA